ncbi:MAG TPA: restriction endonuclease subunit S [Clostridiales bacterium]|nr:restriction endonuclease subunit S [Clostridiales bacterium]
MKLGDIADIKMGLVLSRKKAETEYEIKQEYKLISLKNIEDDGMPNDIPLELFASYEDLDDQYFTQEGDILMRLSHPNTAVYIDKEWTNLLVPSYFAIIRLYKDKGFNPEYVSWYLNSDTIRQELIRVQTGTAIFTTNKNTIASLYIKKIPIKTQEAIVEVQRLHWQERHLLNKLIDEKEKLYRGITDKLINVSEEDFDGEKSYTRED